MRRRKRNKSIIFILILFISIGFAALTANLSINSGITFLPQSFNIYFDNVVVNQNSVNQDLPTISNNDQQVSFTTTINEPGDFYEFSFDVINDGTMDAALTEIVKSGLTETQEKYLNYTARYYGERNIKVDDILHAGYKERVVVRVEYKYYVDEVVSLGNITFNFGLNYIKRDLQKDYGEETWSIEYTGTSRSLTIPKTGLYKLETWGAQGGNYNEEVIGGYGGYSTGTISFNKNKIIYINDGGAGNVLAGGYNGGGNVERHFNDWYGQAGGGSTDISEESGLLSTKSEKIDKIYMVSAGGGGASFSPTKGAFSGGAGGGYVGNDCGEAKGATQTEGGISAIGYRSGTFGQGASSVNEGGGGSGFYGGGSGYHSSIGYGGAGGSGYIGNTSLTNKIMYCYNCQESTLEDDETNIKTRSTTNVSEEPISYYAKKGNGFARITYLGKYNTDQYTVINYHPNGGQGSMNTQVINSNTSLKENRYTRDGYTFVGWSTTEKELNNLINTVSPSSNISMTDNNTYYLNYKSKDTFFIFQLKNTMLKESYYTMMFNVSELDSNNIRFGFPTQDDNNIYLKNGINVIKSNNWLSDRIGNLEIGDYAILDDLKETGVTYEDDFYVNNLFLYKDSEVDYLDKANITYNSNTKTINLYALWSKVES